MRSERINYDALDLKCNKQISLVKFTGMLTNATCVNATTGSLDLLLFTFAELEETGANMPKRGCLPGLTDLAIPVTEKKIKC